MKFVTYFLNTSTEVGDKKINFTELLNSIITWLTTEGVKLVIGLVILFVGIKVANFISNKIRKRMEKRNADKTITRVVFKVIRWVIKLFIFLVFLGYVGIDTAGIGTAIASCGVAVGLALQGSLGNLAGGIIIFCAEIA